MTDNRNPSRKAARFIVSPLSLLQPFASTPSELPPANRRNPTTPGLLKEPASPPRNRDSAILALEFLEGEQGWGEGRIRAHTRDPRTARRDPNRAILHLRIHHPLCSATAQNHAFLERCFNHGSPGFRGYFFPSPSVPSAPSAVKLFSFGCSPSPLHLAGGIRNLCLFSFGADLN
jgi:hypothetical protein